MSPDNNIGTLQESDFTDSQYYKPTIKEKFSYGLGDVASNFSYGMVSGLITLFYTDYAGVAPGIVSLVLVISQIFDGVSDITIGALVDKTKSKYGKARPWLLRMAIPYGIALVLLVTVPSGSNTFHFWYLFVTYNLVTTVTYTAINVPYATLANYITRSSQERTMLGVFRMGMSPLGRILSVSLTLPVVQLFGDNQRAWIITMTIWAIIAMILFFICFKNTEERVYIEAAEKRKIPLKDNLKALLKNNYFYSAIILWTVQAGHNQIIGTVGPYYARYVLGDTAFVYSTLYFLETIVLVIGVLSSSPLIKRFGKRNLALLGSLLVIIAQLSIYISPYNVSWVLFLTIFRALGTVPLNAVLMGFLGDIIEYGQWKTHVRQESFLVSASSSGAKLGMGLTGGAVSFLLSLSGYQETTAGIASQSQTAINTIEHMFIWGPIIIWGVALSILYFYRLDKKLPNIMKDLHERENRGEL